MVMILSKILGMFLNWLSWVLTVLHVVQGSLRRQNVNLRLLSTLVCFGDE